jgi:hypothetical protein
MFKQTNTTAKRCKTGFEVLTAVVMKRSIFWDIMLCSPLKATSGLEEQVG